MWSAWLSACEHGGVFVLESLSHELLHMSYGLVVGTLDFLGVHNAYRDALPPHRSFFGYSPMCTFAFFDTF